MHESGLINGMNKTFKDGTTKYNCRNGNLLTYQKIRFKVANVGEGNSY